MRAGPTNREPTPLEITALGRPAASLPDDGEARLSNGPRHLLATLAAAGPGGATVHTIAEELWREDLPSRWQASVRMAINRLRKPLGHEAISQTAGYYALALPTDAVDVWWLEGLAAASSPVGEPELARALRGAPYADVDGGELVQRAADRARAAQTSVVKRFCTHATSMSELTAAALTAHQREAAPYDEQLVLVIGRSLLDSGHVGSAIGYLRDAVELFASELGVRPPELLDLLTEAERATGAATRRPVGTDDAPGAPAPPATVPPALEHLLNDTCFGREPEIERLLESAGSILLGPSGSGKTRLLAELAARATELGDRVCFVGADPALTPYGPFLAELRELRDVLLVEEGATDADDVDQPGSVESHRVAEANRWVATLEHFEQLATRTWVLLDDVHAFDSASKRLVGFLARARASAPIVLVIAARNDTVDSDWNDLHIELRRSGLADVVLGALSEAALEELLEDRLEGLTVQARRSLARGLLTRNAGLPAIARSLIGTVDEETMTFDADLVAYDPERWVQPAAGLDRSVVDVATAAAVLGMTFTVSELVELLDVAEGDVVDALGQLWDLGRVVDADAPDQLRFQHALVRDAFLRSAPRFRLLRLHERAAALSDDPHAVAEHQAAAIPLVDASVAGESLVASARRYFAGGSWHDAVSRLRMADAATDGGLDIDALILMAQALDRSGVGGAGPRRRAYERAMAEQRWSDALRAALSGLPEAEHPDGDQARIEMLVAVPPERLPPHDAFGRAEALTRQYALNGQPADAVYWSQWTGELATGPHQRARAEIAQWSAAHHVVVAAHDFDPTAVAEASDSDRTRIFQMMALAALERGDYDTAAEYQRRFTELAASIGDPVRIWHGMVLDALSTFDRGGWSEAGELADEAFRYGTRHGMQQAALAWAGHLFMKNWLAGTEGDLEQQFEAMKADTGTSSVAGAAHALVLAGAGRGSTAWAAAEALVRDALARPRSQAIVVLAMLSGLVADFGDDALQDDVRRRLRPFADRSIVLGYGIGNAGPTWRTLSRLARDESERLRCLEQAVTCADASGSLLWRVVTRTDLARAAGGHERWADVASLVDGTDLEGRLIVP